MTSKNSKSAAAFTIIEEIEPEVAEPVWHESDKWVVLIELESGSTWHAQNVDGDKGLVRIPEFRRKQVDGMAFKFHWEPSPTASNPDREVFVVDKMARIA